MRLPVTHVRLVQVLAVAWLFTGQSLVWPGAPLARVLLASISTALCLGLIFSRHTRGLALSLGALILAVAAWQPTWFAHNRLFVASLLVMVGLSSRRGPWLPRLQVGLVYLLAALDKLGEPAWRDGRFVGSFLEQLARFGLMWAPGGSVGAPNLPAQWVAAHGSPQLYQLAGAGVIALELALAACFVFGVRRAVWLNVAFHVGIYTLTGSTMGQFFFAGAAASLLLLREAEVPRPAPLILVTVALAGPWTHRALPLLGLLALLLRRRSSR